MAASADTRQSEQDRPRGPAREAREQKVGAHGEHELAPERRKTEPSLTSDDPRERKKAVRALGESESPEAVELLGLALEDRGWDASGSLPRPFQTIGLRVSPRGVDR